MNARHASSLALPLIALALASCATNNKRASDTPPEPVLYEWHGDTLSGPVRVEIDLSEQVARIYIGGEYAGWTTVATGRKLHWTPTGSFRITEKIVDKHSTLYGQVVDANGNVVISDGDTRKHSPPPGGRFLHAPMPYWMRLTNWGIGMHAGPIPQPGSRASHGCIRLPKDFAPILFSRVSVGTPVRIRH